MYTIPRVTYVQLTILLFIVQFVHILIYFMSLLSLILYMSYLPNYNLKNHFLKTSCYYYTLKVIKSYYIFLNSLILTIFSFYTIAVLNFYIICIFNVIIFSKIFCLPISFVFSMACDFVM